MGLIKDKMKKFWKWFEGICYPEIGKIDLTK